MEKTENDAIEDEDTSSDGVGIIHPFKPGDIEIHSPPFTIGSLMDKIEYGDINMNVDFQRSGNLWTPEKQSRLIESILLGLPLPAFYFDTSSRAWDIIDGLQRCCSIQNFCVNKTLKLTGLEYLDLDGQGFDDFDRPLLRSIIQCPITVHQLKKSPPNVRYILFKRLNTGGLVLTPQEIRNAIYQGKATKGLEELSKIVVEFFKMAKGQFSTNRMQDKDFACRFVAFYLTDYTKYTPDLDSFLNSTMNLLEKADIESIKRDLRKALQLAIDIFGTEAFRKKIKTAKRSPINKAYFEVIAVNFARLNSKDEKSLRQHSELFKDNLIKMMRSKRYENSLAVTGNKDSVIIRFSWFQEVMQNSIKGLKIRVNKDDNKIEII
jgi:hypothetical protein